MNENGVFNPDGNTLSINEDESKLLFDELTIFPSFRHGELIKNYLSGSSAEEITKKRDRLESILMYYRNLASRETRYFFSPTLANETLKLLYGCKIKAPKQKLDCLEKLFTVCGETNAKVFRGEIISKLLQCGDELDADWKGKLKAVVSILKDTQVFRSASSALLVNIFNNELAGSIERSPNEKPLQSQAFQETKIRVNRVILQEVKDHLSSVKWVRK